MKFLILLTTILFSFSACAMSKKAPPEVVAPVVVEPTPVVTPAPVKATPAKLQAAIAWEHPSYPARTAWGNQVFDLVYNELFDTFDAAKDAKKLCPKYETLNKAQRATVWVQFVAAITKYESAYNPLSRMKEPVSSFPKGDAVTGLAVYSEGLLQLSYQDVKGYPFCKLDWTKDKKLAAADPKKTILDPKLNLDCGVRILAKQIARQTTAISPKSSGYWSVLRDGGRWGKVSEITALTKKLNFCQ